MGRQGYGSWRCWVSVAASKGAPAKLGCDRDRPADSGDSARCYSGEEKEMVPEAMNDIRDKIFGMTSAAREVMRCLFLLGPTWDGNIPSKSGRNELVDLGYAERWKGWAWLTRKGAEFAITSMDLGNEKERRKAG